jgi:hypothetical protein
MMIDDFALARAIHVLAVVHWIGGVAVVTTVILPRAHALLDAQEAVAAFEAFERRFASQARISILLAGVSGAYMLTKIGGSGGSLGLGLSRNLLLDLDQLAASTLSLHPTEHGEDILDLLGIDLLRGQDRVDLVMCDVATLLGGADELYGRIGEAGQRAIRDGLAILLLERPFLGLLGERLDLAYHVPLLGQR